MTKQEFIKAFKTIEGQVNPLQKFITKVGIIEMINKSTDENVENVFNALLESITTTGVVKYDNNEITIGITTESIDAQTTAPEEPVVDEPKAEEPVVDEPKAEEPLVTEQDEPVVNPEEPITDPADEPVTDPADEPVTDPDVPTTELPETEQ